MYYTSQTKTDSLVRIPELIDRSLHTYSPCSTNTIYVMHYSPCVTTQVTNLHFNIRFWLRFVMIQKQTHNLVFTQSHYT